MGRIFVFTGCWFAFWMGVGVIIGVHARGLDGLIAGAQNGAYLATLLSFAWPWLMPEAVDRWLDG